MTSLTPRRASRVATALAGVAIAALALAGCASGAATPAASSSGDAAAGFGDLTIQLSWIKNDEFAGEFFADTKGYYTDAGFDSVDLVPGPAPAAAGVISGNADVGIARRRLDRHGHRRGGRAAEDHRRDVPEEPVHDPLAGKGGGNIATPKTCRQEDRRAGSQPERCSRRSSRPTTSTRPTLTDRPGASTTRRR